MYIIALMHISLLEGFTAFSITFCVYKSTAIETKISREGCIDGGDFSHTDEYTRASGVTGLQHHIVIAIISVYIVTI